MEIARYWRGQEGRYAGQGRNPFRVEIDEDEMHLENPFNGREVSLNHGDEKAWARAMVEAVHEWNYNEVTARQMIEGAAAQLNGKGESFLTAAAEAMAEVYGK